MLESRRKWITAGVILCLVIIAGASIYLFRAARGHASIGFDGQAAYQHIQTQLSFGPRLPGSQAQQRFLRWAAAEFEQCGWSVSTQQGTQAGHALINMIAKKGSGDRLILLTAHYDSRLVADKDPKYPAVIAPVAGANDGASGAAVLLELARVLEIPADTTVWIVLFDVEDNGRIPGWDWILGSTYFVDHLDRIPQAVVNLDMVGDADLRILPEINSTGWLREEIWTTAAKMGYGDVFTNDDGKSILDDHIPFLKAGIPAVDVIDIEYPYHHTRSDTLEHVSAESLAVVGRVIEGWLEEY